MADRLLALAADDGPFAGAIQAFLKKHLGQRARESPLATVDAPSDPHQRGTLLLAAASAADVEAVRRVAHECYWQQRSVEVLVLVHDSVWENNELACLDPYVAGRLHWPDDAQTVLRQIRARWSQEDVSGALGQGLLEERIREQLRARTPSLLGLAEPLALAAAHDVHLLLTGETGTGKTFFARQVHENSDRAKDRLMVVACGSLVANLVESELFGHTRGAFTGAQRPKMGKLEAVGAGTLLLDEVDTLGLEQQAKLLRVVETGEYEPVGSNRTRTCKARFIFASNIDLEAAVAAEKFRKDLYYRINVLSLHLPPLRERIEDIVPLAQALVARFGQQFHKGPLTLSPAARAALESFAWPGNIRQLENAIQHAVLVCSGPELQLRHLPTALHEPGIKLAKDAERPSLLDNRQTFERGVIQQALHNSNQNRARAAHALGISRVTLYKKMKKYGLMHGERQAV